MTTRTNPRNGDQFSALAFGCMRLPSDFALAERLVRTAIERGVNVLDTAYIYPGNEEKVGKILTPALRDKIFLNTKLPPQMCKSAADFDKIFDTSKKRLRTDHIDYYFMHMLTSPADWQRLVGFGIEDWIAKKKQSGEIRNLGFSFHGSAADYLTCLNAYDWDFTMIQYNYFDQNNQAGQAGLLAAARKGLPIMIMEPLRGGTLATPPKPVTAAFARAVPGQSPAQWSFRWLYDQPEISTVLSGMDNMSALEENLATAASAEVGCLSRTERETIDLVREILRGLQKVPCTGCGYCTPCPREVDIPTCFSTYNATDISKWKNVLYYILRLPGHNASRCNGCGRCRSHCPQMIDIPTQLKAVARDMEGVRYKLMRKPISLYMKRR